MAVTANRQFPLGASGPSFALRLSVQLVAGALACCATPAHATEWKVTPHVELSETYSDNVTLAPSGSEKAEWVTQFNPGVSIEAKGANLRLKSDYMLQNPVYANDSSHNNFYHQLNANANATLVDNSLFLDASGNIRQQPASLLGPLPNGNLNTGNVADVSSYSVSPYLLHKFGSTAEGQFRFTHDAVSSDVGGLSDSSASRVSLSLNSGAAFKDMDWGITYTGEKVDYDLRPDVETQILTGTASYPLMPKLRVAVTAGYEKNNFVYLGVGEPRGSFWSAGLSWSPNMQTNMNVSAGEHFFGKIYGFSFKHLTAQTTWVADYTQNISSTRRDALNPQIQLAAYNLQLFSNLAGTPLSDQQAMQLAEDAAVSLGIPLLAFTNQYYLSKQLLGSVAIKRGKSLITLAVTHSVRESVEATSIGSASFSAENNVKQYGLNAQWAIQMSPRNTLNLGGGLTQSVFPDLSRTDDQGFITLGVARKLEKKLTGSVNFRHTSRTSSDSRSEYAENALTGRLSWSW